MSEIKDLPWPTQPLSTLTGPIYRQTVPLTHYEFMTLGADQGLGKSPSQILLLPPPSLHTRIPSSWWLLGFEQAGPDQVRPKAINSRRQGRRGEGGGGKDNTMTFFSSYNVYQPSRQFWFQSDQNYMSCSKKHYLMTDRLNRLTFKMDTHAEGYKHSSCSSQITSKFADWRADFLSSLVIF